MLRSFLILLLAALLLPSFTWSMVKQDIAVRIDPARQLLEARAILYDEPGPPAQEAVYLLAPGAEIRAVRADQEPIPYRFESGQLIIRKLPSNAPTTIDYRIRFDNPLPKNMASIEDPSFGIAATITPEGTYLSETSGWHPRPASGKSLYRVTISGPAGLVGVTSGKLISSGIDDNGTKTVWQVSFPEKSLALAAGAYRIERDMVGDIDLITFMRDQNRELARPYLDACRKYIQLYQKLFGPYPYPAFSVVENFYPTGYGLPGWTLLGSSVIRLPFIRYTSLPHEIAHAWWGNAVEIEHKTGNWGEGLATYVADYYLKELTSPAEAAEYRRKILRDFSTLVSGEGAYPLVDFRSRMSKQDQAIGYGKAAMVYHLLRRKIGDTAFWNGLRLVVANGRGQVYGWRDLQRHFEEAAGTSLEPFFEQWLMRAGAPTFRLSTVKSSKTKTGWRINGTIVQAEPAYELSLPIAIETETGTIERLLNISSVGTDFAIDTDDRPLNLAVDPDNHIFRRLFPEERPATINHLRAGRSPTVVVAEEGKDLFSAARDLLLGLHWQDADVISTTDFRKGDSSDSDVLFIGRPSNILPPPTLPDGFSIEPHRFTIAGQRYDHGEDALFMVLSNRRGDQVHAYFLANSMTAVEATARRIPHYGRYSYLIFRAGENLVKATWEPESSPLKYNFKQELKK